MGSVQQTPLPDARAQWHTSARSSELFESKESRAFFDDEELCCSSPPGGFGRRDGDREGRGVRLSDGTGLLRQEVRLSLWRWPEWDARRRWLRRCFPLQLRAHCRPRPRRRPRCWWSLRRSWTLLRQLRWSHPLRLSLARLG